MINNILSLIVLLTIVQQSIASRFNVFRAFALQERNWNDEGSHTHVNNKYNKKYGTNSTTHFFTGAIVDHFGSWKGSHEKWNQRFYVDQTVWGGNDFPIFLYIGGEGPQGPVSDGLYMKTLANKHRALVVALEHRFYGESRPTSDQSVASLQVLSSEQALADLAKFVESLKNGDMVQEANPSLSLKYSAHNSKVIVFGGSYPGSLSAFFHLKYPHLSVGSIASSAPVFAEYNFEQYAQVVGYALGYPLIGGSQECVTTLTKANEALYNLASSTVPRASSPEIPEFLKPCESLEGELDFAQYLSTIFGNFQGAVQYNVPGRSKNTVAKMCDTLLDEGDQKQWKEPIDRLANTMALFVPNASAPFKERCIASSFQKDLIGLVKNTSFSDKNCDLQCTSTRQWIWQSCNEFGFFQTTTGVNQPFSAFAKEITVQNVGKELCEQAFPGAWGTGEYNGPRITWTNTHYGNRDIASVNTTLPNGSGDPWHALGIVNSTDLFYNSGCDQEGTEGCAKQKLKASDQAVFIDGTSHCRDMFAPVPPDSKVIDSEAVIWAHAKIAENVATYLL